jgi:hypothetical protein
MARAADFQRSRDHKICERIAGIKRAADWLRSRAKQNNLTEKPSIGENRRYWRHSTRVTLRALQVSK